MKFFPIQPPSARALKGSDLESYTQAINPVVEGPNQVGPRTQSVAMITDGNAHGRIAQIRDSVAVVSNLAGSLTLAGTDADKRADDFMPEIDAAGFGLGIMASSIGSLAIDINEIPNLCVGLYIGSAKWVKVGDETKTATVPVYAVNRSPKRFIITNGTAVRTNQYRYTAKIARLKGNPTHVADVWEAHPDSPDYDLWNAFEFGNTSTHVYGGQIAIDDTLTGIARIPNGAIVLASPHSFPKHGANDGGSCWVFDRENKPAISCP